MIESAVIVDDEPMNLVILKEYLKKVGVYNIHEFKNGLEALTFLKEHSCSVDILLTDYQMPEMNGVELMKKVKGMCNNLPIFLITAFEYVYVDEEEKIEDEFIKKPISFEIFKILFERYNKE